MNKNITKYFALGGLGEVGKNMYVVEENDELIILDAGSIFPEESSLGIDYIVGDINYLKENEKKIKALVITHGHEDHIGAVPYLVNYVNIPVIYAPNQAKELIELKLKDHNIVYNNIVVFDKDSKFKTKNFTIEFFTVNHSVPDSFGIAVTTSNGLIVTTGDFKFDLTPIGPKADFDKMIELSKRGVTLLVSDSTNALVPGFSLSEAVVDNTLNEIFSKYKNRRLIIATFASNIYRLKHIVETCYKFNKKIVLFGRSMENNINISLKGHYINHPEIFVKKEEVNTINQKDLVILCTGTQGEPLAALSRIAKGTHKQIKLLPDDIIIFSSSAIPGNARAINSTMNKLCLQGVKVITKDDFKIHTSGHANQEELKLMLTLISPKFFAPLHGEYRMLKQHTKLANECGIPIENTFILDNGKTLILDNGNVSYGPQINVNPIYVDNSKLQEVNGVVLKDRNIMSSDGILIVIANISTKNKQLLTNPNITTRGFVMINESESLLKEIEKIAKDSILETLNESNHISDIKNKLVSDLYPYISNKTDRRPIIVPVIIDINK